MTYREAIDFFLTALPEDSTEDERQNLVETRPTVNELAAAIYVAINTAERDLMDVFNAALAIIDYWGKLEDDPTELTYNEAINNLASTPEVAEGMKSERAPVPLVTETCILSIMSGAIGVFDGLESALRILYEYHLWDLKNSKGDDNEAEGATEGT